MERDGWETGGKQVGVGWEDRRAWAGVRGEQEKERSAAIHERVETLTMPLPSLQGHHIAEPFSKAPTDLSAFRSPLDILPQ